MASVQLKLGPTDHGRRISLDDFDEAEFEPSFKYEIIDGRVYVSTEPNLPEVLLENWLLRKLMNSTVEHPEVLDFVTLKSRPFIHPHRAATVPEPEIAAYQNFPWDKQFKDLRWQEVGPILVAEVLVEGDPYKDLERNRQLHLDAPTVREYWILDGRDDPDEPTLIQNRRYGKRWVIRSFPYGSIFTTKLLPGFTLMVDPRK